MLGMITLGTTPTNGKKHLLKQNMMSWAISTGSGPLMKNFLGTA